MPKGSSSLVMRGSADLNATTPFYNKTTTDILAGAPVYTLGGEVGGGLMPASLSHHFAGVTASAVNALQSTASGVISEGVALANFKGHASAIVNSWVRPVPGTQYFTYSAVPTGITLLTDMTADTSIHYISSSTQAEIMISPPATNYNQMIWVAPVATDDDWLVVSTNMKVGAYTIVTGHTALPEARALLVTVTSVSTADTMGTLAVVGTDINDDALTETITPAQNTTTAGVKAFKTVTSITGAAWVIATTEDTIKIGFGDKLGLPITYSAAPIALHTTLNNAIESTAPTFTVDADEVCKNLVDINSSLNGTAVMVLLPF